MGISILENVALAPLTTLKVGGAARFFVETKTEQDICEAVSFARENDLPLFVLGGGSNVLITGEGFNGLTLKIAHKGKEIFENDQPVSIVAEAGEDWDEFVEFCVSRNLQGVECLSGIPGTIGGTPVQNVGAYGQEVSETISKVRAFDRKSSQFLDLSNADCKFGYRTSIFNTTDKNRFIVTAVTFDLKKNGKPKIVYRDLQNYFGANQPTLDETRRAVLQIRRAKSMVIDESDPNSKSAGSFFKNPIVSREKFADVIKLAQAFGIENVPNYDADDNRVKIPAAWLIENSGFHKGYKLGKAGLSSNHTLALINLGDAEAGDIVNLMRAIQEKVEKTFHIKLTAEPVFVGF